MTRLTSQLADIRGVMSSDPTAALKSARRLLSDHAEDPDVLALVAECCLETGDDAGAQRYARRAVSSSPGHGIGNLILGKLSAKRNRLRRAIPYFQEAIRSPQSRVEAHKLISKPLFELARSKAEYSKARNYLSTYLHHHPEDTEAWMDLAWQYYYCGRWAECDEICEKVKAIDPKSARPHIMRGLSRNMQGMYADAMTCYRRAIEVDPTGDRPYERMSILKHMLNHYAGAVECALYALQLNSQSPRNWTSLLYVLDSAMNRLLFPKSDLMNMPELTRQICEAALAHAMDDSAESVMLRYRVYQRLGDEDASLIEGRKYVRLFPDTKVTQMMRGVIRSRKVSQPEADEEEDETAQEFLGDFGYLLPSSPIESDEVREIERLWELFQAGSLPRPEV